MEEMERLEKLAGIIKKLEKIDYTGLNIIDAGADVLEKYQNIQKKENEKKKDEMMLV